MRYGAESLLRDLQDLYRLSRVARADTRDWDAQEVKVPLSWGDLHLSLGNKLQEIGQMAREGIEFKSVGHDIMMGGSYLIGVKRVCPYPTTEAY